MDQQTTPTPVREGFQPDVTVTTGGNGVAPAPAAVAIPAPPPPKPLETWPMRVRLEFKPLKEPTKGELRELVLREPTAGDIARNGNPVKMDNTGAFIFDERKMLMMISALSGILTPIIEQMDPRDWNTVSYKLLRFFLPGPAAWD